MQIFLFSYEPKNKQNYSFISALASKNGSNQKNKGKEIHTLEGQGKNDLP